MYGWAALAAALSQLQPAAKPERSLVGAASTPADLALQFPPRYRGAFERDQHHEHDDTGRTALGHEALGHEARSMLTRRFGPAASDLVSILERMAAAAAEAGDSRADGRE
jgi:hypothetical protein